MVKTAQHTKFDELVQPKERQHWNNPKQRLLFPEKKPGHYNEVVEEDIEDPELDKPREYLDPHYPELGQEHIKTNITTDVNKPEYRGYHYDPKPKPSITPIDTESVITEQKDNGLFDPENAIDTTEAKERLNKAVKLKILSRYKKLRKTAITFYMYYQEANAMVESNDFHLDLNGTYAEIFSNYGKLVTQRLTQEIGRLFGGNLQRHHGIKYLYDRGINIFNITDANYHEKARELDLLTKYMEDVIKDYEKRKKLLKYIGPKIQEESDRALQMPEWIKFFSWMDEYFPNYKSDLVKMTFNNLDNHASRNSKNISLGDLVKFKTFKSIYEKAQTTTTTTFRSQIEYSITRDLEEAVQEELYNRIVRIFISLANYLGSIDKTLTSEEQCNQVILFLRKNLNLDVRSIFTFSTNASKKAIESYYLDAAVPEGIDPEVHKNNIQNAIQENSGALYMYFINRLDYFIKNFLEKNRDDNWIAKWGLKGVVSELVNKIVGYHNRINIELHSKLLKANSKDFEQISAQFIYNFILKSISGIDSEYNHHRETLKTKSPAFGGIGKVITESDGKFSIEAFTNYAHQAIPSASKELLFAAVKAMFRELDYKSLNYISALSNAPSFSVMAEMIVKILQKNNKLNSDNFYKLFKNIPAYANIYNELSNNFPGSFISDDILPIITDSVRSYQTVDQDLANLVIFAKFIHNEAGSLSDDIIKKIIQNKNFINFNKIGIVKKLFKSYTQIKNNGGIKGIYEKYGKLITALKQKKYVSTTFKENLFLITKFFESNEEINPASPLFAKLFEVASQIETDLGILEMGDALKDLLKGYKPKSPKLFDLNYALRDDLRFRVLGDKDPRILRIGVETSCCQRLQGVGASAAKDSFINPLSSVLILEWKDKSDNEWKLLTQSYFHYVPQDNGYILDNVEHNAKNVQSFKDNNPDMSIEDIYAVYAAEIKNKLDVPYFLSGKGYSKIRTDQFNTERKDDDPRFFDDRALKSKNDDHYSDYDEHNSMNLLSPNFNIESAKNKVFAPAIKKSHLQMRRFIRSILNPRKLNKFSQAPTTPTAQPAPSNQDIRDLQGVNTQSFGPQSWEFLNKFMNVLNENLYKLGSVNFQTVIKTPTMETKFTGGLKSLFEISTKLWGIVSARRAQPYTVNDSLNIINSLTNQVNTSDFPEPAAQNIKPQLINILNGWTSILK